MRLGLDFEISLPIAPENIADAKEIGEARFGSVRVKVNNLVLGLAQQGRLKSAQQNKLVDNLQIIRAVKRGDVDAISQEIVLQLGLMQNTMDEKLTNPQDNLAAVVKSFIELDVPLEYPIKCHPNTLQVKNQLLHKVDRLEKSVLKEQELINKFTKTRANDLVSLDLSKQNLSLEQLQPMKKIITRESRLKQLEQLKLKQAEIRKSMVQSYYQQKSRTNSSLQKEKLDENSDDHKIINVLSRINESEENCSFRIEQKDEKVADTQNTSAIKHYNTFKDEKQKESAVVLNYAEQPTESKNELQISDLHKSKNNSEVIDLKTIEQIAVAEKQQEQQQRISNELNKQTTNKNNSSQVLKDNKSNKKLVQNLLNLSNSTNKSPSEDVQPTKKQKITQKQMIKKYKLEQEKEQKIANSEKYTQNVSNEDQQVFLKLNSVQNYNCADLLFENDQERAQFLSIPFSQREEAKQIIQLQFNGNFADYLKAVESKNYLKQMEAMQKKMNKSQAKRKVDLFGQTVDKMSSALGQGSLENVELQVVQKPASKSNVRKMDKPQNLPKAEAQQIQEPLYKPLEFIKLEVEAEQRIVVEVIKPDQVLELQKKRLDLIEARRKQNDYQYVADPRRCRSSFKSQKKFAINQQEVGNKNIRLSRFKIKKPQNQALRKSKSYKGLQITEKIEQNKSVTNLYKFKFYELPSSTREQPEQRSSNEFVNQFAADIKYKIDLQQFADFHVKPCNVFQNQLLITNYPQLYDKQDKVIELFGTNLMLLLMPAIHDYLSPSSFYLQFNASKFQKDSTLQFYSPDLYDKNCITAIPIQYLFKQYMMRQSQMFPEQIKQLLLKSQVSSKEMSIFNLGHLYFFFLQTSATSIITFQNENKNQFERHIRRQKHFRFRFPLHAILEKQNKLKASLNEICYNQIQILLCRMCGLQESINIFQNAISYKMFNYYLSVKNQTELNIQQLQKYVKYQNNIRDLQFFSTQLETQHKDLTDNPFDSSFKTVQIQMFDQFFVIFGDNRVSETFEMRNLQFFEQFEQIHQLNALRAFGYLNNQDGTSFYQKKCQAVPISLFQLYILFEENKISKYQFLVEFLKIQQIWRVENTLSLLPLLFKITLGQTLKIHQKLLNFNLELLFSDIEAVLGQSQLNFSDQKFLFDYFQRCKRVPDKQIRAKSVAQNRFGLDFSNKMVVKNEASVQKQENKSQAQNTNPVVIMDQSQNPQEIAQNSRLAEGGPEVELEQKDVFSLLDETLRVEKPKIQPKYHKQFIGEDLMNEIIQRRQETESRQTTNKQSTPVRLAKIKAISPMKFQADKFEIRNVTKERKVRVPLKLVGDLGKQQKMVQRLVGKK